MDWMKLLDDHRIQYVTRGPNTRKGEISIKCPWCAEDDPSEHMGINLSKEAWGCHRSAQHRGKAPFRLVQAILGCSSRQAGIVVSQYNHTDPDQLDNEILLQSRILQAQKQIHPIILPETKEIKPIGSTARFYNYLKRRGFDDVVDLCRRYSLGACTYGQFKDRIVIPVSDGAGELKSFTARAIVNPVAAPRYLSHGDIKQHIFNAEAVSWGGDSLFITEGPFDAIKVDYYASDLQSRATCLFGTSTTVDQIVGLRNSAKRFRRIVILLDSDAIGPAFALAEAIPNAIIEQLPPSVKDPGDLTKEQIRILVQAG